jgi:hypothetical protein
MSNQRDAHFPPRKRKRSSVTEMPIVDTPAPTNSLPFWNDFTTTLSKKLWLPTKDATKPVCTGTLEKSHRDSMQGSWFHAETSKSVEPQLARPDLWFPILHRSLPPGSRRSVRKKTKCRKKVKTKKTRNKNPPA